MRVSAVGNMPPARHREFLARRALRRGSGLRCDLESQGGDLLHVESGAGLERARVRSKEATNSLHA